MSESQSPASPDDAVAHARQDAGAQLRAAREAHGLSIETVAQHLKLAPRQVRALEDGDASQLPGRTFIRGFARNYARLMHLDPEAIVAALPDAEVAVATESALGTPTRPMGELPASQPRENVAWPRLALLLVAAALAGVAAYYELGRDNAPRSDVGNKKRTSVEGVTDPIGPPPGDGTPLPNPVVQDARPAGAPSAAVDPTTHSGPLASPTTTLPITSASVAASPASTGTRDATLVIKYAGPAWTEVRDANGQRLLLVTGAPGASETVTGTPPFELILGNAANVSIDWRGAAYDLAPHVKGNVARVRLP